MKGKAALKREYSLQISTEALREINLSIEQFQQRLVELKLILGSKFEWIVPKELNGVPSLQFVIELSQRLQRLRQCDGFDLHLNTYTRKQLQSAYFVTLIASYLLGKVDTIVLEPLVTGSNKRSDVLASYIGQQIYIECKRIETQQFDYSEQHKHMFSILQNYIDVPHQISIRYKKPFSDSELYSLGETLRQRLRVVTGDGRIIDNPDLEVQVTIRKAYAHKGVSATFGMILEHTNDNCRYPSNAYVSHGVTVMLSGPEVDYSRILREKIRRSRRQVPHDRAYMLMIDGKSMLGDIANNIRALSSAFQPETNTRFSAAAIAIIHSPMGTPGISLTFHVVPNPFAQFPLSKEFQHLFQISLQV